MKKYIYLLLCATALFYFVACEKEKTTDGGNGGTEQPTQPDSTETVKFNRGTPIVLPIQESGKKGGHYDAKTIYDNVCKIHLHSLKLEEAGLDWEMFMASDFAYYQFRDTVEKKIAMRGDLAIESLDGVTPYAPGNFAYWRDIVFVVYTNEDGSLFELTPYIGKWDDFDSDYSAGKIPKTYDTVAYIPNAVMDSMQPLMEKAFYDQDWAKCYDLFKNGYEILPISADEYRELARQNRN